MSELPKKWKLNRDHRPINTNHVCTALAAIEAYHEEQSGDMPYKETTT